MIERHGTNLFSARVDAVWTEWRFLGQIRDSQPEPWYLDNFSPARDIRELWYKPVAHAKFSYIVIDLHRKSDGLLEGFYALLSSVPKN